MKKEGWQPKKGLNPGLVDISLPRFTASLLRYVRPTQCFPCLFSRPGYWEAFQPKGVREHRGGLYCSSDRLLSYPK
jgi:hypothetical protein